MFPYLINSLKKVRKSKTVKKRGLPTDCLIEDVEETILRFWKGEITDSVRLLDKIIPKVSKYKRGGIAGTIYNQSGFILPMILPSAVEEQLRLEKLKEFNLETLLQELLTNGYHMVFEEVYNLIQMDLKERREYELVYGALKTKPLNEQLDTIQYIVKFLKDAESAKNNEDFGLLFACHLNLAKTFAENQSPLASRFFDLCLNIANEYPCDEDGSSMALSNLHIGLFDMANDDLESAFQHLMYVYEFTRGKPHIDRSMFAKATENLVQVCLNIGKIRRTYNQFMESEEYFNKAFKFARENGDVPLIIDAMYNLGTFCMVRKKYKEALEYLIECFAMCEALSDWQKMATVCQAIGAVYFRLDDLEKAKEYYAKFVEVSDGAEDKSILTDSYMQTGLAFNNAGHYDMAVEYTSKAYQSVKENPDNMELRNYDMKARSLLGIAKAHLHMPTILTYITKIYMENLMNWKEFRFTEDDARALDSGSLGDMKYRRENMLRKSLGKSQETSRYFGV